MSWALFSWVVLLPGALLTVLLASGRAPMMFTASKALDTPLTLGNFQVTTAAFMSSFCGALSLLCYSALRHSEARLEGVQSTTAGVLGGEKLMQLNVFLSGRNLYMALLGFTLWTVAWRLKVLRDAQMLVPPPKSGARGSPVARAAYVAAGLFALAMADIPLCRLNYNLQLSMSVTPRKNRLLAGVGPCESAALATASGPCGEFCEDAKRLSQERLATIQWARDWHFLGRVAAELFDDSRGVRQGADRIEELFAKKTCAQVVRSADRSNQMVNGACFVFAGVAIMGAITAFVNAFDPDVAGGERGGAAPVNVPSYGGGPKQD